MSETREDRSSLLDNVDFDPYDGVGDRSPINMDEGGNREEEDGSQSLLNLLFCGKKSRDMDEIDLITRKQPEYYLKKNIWTCFGRLHEENLGNCFGLFPLHRYNVYDCFGLRDPQGKLGSFLGVVVPVILDCFGVILFLRLPMIVGNAGILLSIGMFTFAYFICVLTVISAATIATGGQMGDGGPYFMTSRILGPVLGGSIGIILLAANIAGTALYIVGFCNTFEHSVRSVESVFGDYWSTIVIGSCLLVVLSCIVFFGASLFSKAALLIWIILMISIFTVFLSFGGFLESGIFHSQLEHAKKNGYVGWSRQNFVRNLLPYNEEQVPYKTMSVDCVQTVEDPSNNCTINCFEKHYHAETDWSEFGIDQETGKRLDIRGLFAIFFPAVTGILAGTNLSGDLTNPSLAISRGTFIAVFFTYVIYISLIVFIGSTTDQASLVGNYNVVLEIALSSVFIKIGVFLATLSSAMTSMIGSTRLLFALSYDNIFPFLGLFSVQCCGEPQIALLLVWFLVQCCLFMGDLDVIAPFVSMFFIFTFVILNLACLLLAVLKPPNFRPTIHLYSWWTCLLGFASCVFMMFYLDYKWALTCLAACVIVMVVIALYTTCKPKKEWGSFIDAVLYFLSTYSLYGMMKRSKKHHIKYWKFKALLFVSEKRCFDDQGNIRKCNLVKFVNQLTCHHGGMCILGNVNRLKIPEGSRTKNRFFRERYHFLERKREKFVELVRKLKLTMFPSVFTSSSVRRGIQDTIITAGIGAVKPGCIILGWYNHNERSSNHREFDLHEYMETIKDILSLKKTLLITRNFDLLNNTIFSPNMCDKFIQCTKLRRKKFIDLWIFSNGLTDEFVGPSVSLIIQLGFLLKSGPNRMLRKHHKLRILALTTIYTQSKKNYKERIAYFVKKLGVQCEIEVVELVYQDYDFIESIPSLESTSLNSHHDPNSYESVGFVEKELKDSPVLENDSSNIPLLIHAEKDNDTDEELEEGGEESLQKTVESDEEDSEEEEEKEENQLFDRGEKVKEEEIEIIVKEKNTCNSDEEEEQEQQHEHDHIIEAECDDHLSEEEEDEDFIISESDVEEKRKIEEEKPTFFFGNRQFVSFGDLTVSISGKVPMISIPGHHHHQQGESLQLSMKQMVKILNNVIRRHSEKTSIIFLSFPPPPSIFEREHHTQFFEELDTLTDTEIPTVLVHSVEKVLCLHI